MIIYFLPLFALIFIIIILIRDRYKYFNFYRELGCDSISILIFPHTKCHLNYDGVRFTIGTKGYRGNFRFFIELDTNTNGYLIIRRPNVFDSIKRNYTFPEKKLFANYDDAVWFNYFLTKIKLKENLLELFVKFSLQNIKLKDNKFVIEKRIYRGPWEISKDDIFLIIKELLLLREELNLLPLSSVGSSLENKRIIFSYYLPIIMCLTLVLVGILGGFYRYDFVCLNESIILGYKLLLPVILIFTLLITFWLSAINDRFNFFLTILFFNLFLSFFAILFFLPYLNGRYDNTNPIRKEDVVSLKYRSNRGGYRVRLERFKAEKPYCEDFNVSKDFYQRINKGDLVEYSTKRGYLGIEWMFQGLKRID